MGNNIRDKYISIYDNLVNVLGNSDAAKLCYEYFIVAQYWDDLIDRDVELTDKEIHDAFITLSISIPSNNFYRAYAHKILPIIETTIYKWLSANRYEDKCESLHKAYMLRAGIYDLFSMCYIILHGILGDVNIYDLYGEIFEDYEKEMKCQIQ